MGVEQAELTAAPVAHGPHPPRPGLALTLGITGHRRLDAGQAAALDAALGALLERVRAAVESVARTHAGVFADCAPSLALVSGLADGADRIAARAALRAGFVLEALLPFPKAEYARDFEAESLGEFEELLGLAGAVWALPADRSEGSHGYALAGEATVAACDVLVAAWDGAEARGPGGTAHVIDDAVRRGVPVVHLPTDGRDAQVLWAGFDALSPELLRRATAPVRPLAGDALEAALRAVLEPPEAAPEIALFFAEHERRVRWRLEWPLLLALTGVQRLRRTSVRAPGYAAAAHDDWNAYRAGAGAACGPAAGTAALQAAFAWADGLATHYATVFRSGMVLNFSGAALAVVVSLLTWLVPQYKVPLLVVELVLIAAVIANTRVGTQRQWHRRWLDYRYLAETLRLLRSLKLLGAASPPGRARPGERRWTDWYALAVWRAMGSPPGIADAEALAKLGGHIAAHELDGQIAYHNSVAHRMHVLDHRLHRLGSVLFQATIAVGLTTLLGLVFFYAATKPFVTVLSVLSSVLPTVGAGLFGLRAAGDFVGSAGRSAETARRLKRVAGVLRRERLDHATAARAGEEAAAIMLDDLSEWRSTYTHRKLAIPS